MTWNQRIAEALILTPPRFTTADVHRASSWATCKWGEMVIERKLVGLKFGNGAAPRDMVMHDLGYDFSKAVVFNQVSEAVRVSEAMEARARELAESALAHDAISVEAVQA